MQPQVNDNLEAMFPGLIAHFNGNQDIVTRINNSKQLDIYTVTAADLATTITINGTAFTANAGAAAATKEAIRDELVTLINAGAEPVTATADPDNTDKVFVEADVSGTAFTGAATTNVTVVNLILNETSIPFGVYVTDDVDNPGGTQRLAHLPGDADDVTSEARFGGVTVHAHVVENALAPASNVGYETQSDMSVLRKGRIVVETEQVVKKTDPVYVRRVAGAGEQRGAFRKDADTADASILPNSRYYENSRVVGGKNLVILELY